MKLLFPVRLNRIEYLVRILLLTAIVFVISYCLQPHSSWGGYLVYWIFSTFVGIYAFMFMSVPRANDTKIGHVLIPLVTVMSLFWLLKAWIPFGMLLVPLFLVLQSVIALCLFFLESREPSLISEA